MTAECNTVRIIAINLHTNWLMPIGDRECNLNIQHNCITLFCLLDFKLIAVLILCLNF